MKDVGGKKVRGVGKRVRKNTGLMLGSKGIGAVMALAGLAFAARGLTTVEFGVLVFLHAYILLFTEVASFKSWIVVVRYAAGGLTGDEAGRADPGRFGRAVRFCATLDLLSATVGLAVAVAVAAALGGRIGIIDQAWPYIFAYCGLIFLNQKSTSVGVLRLFDRYDLIAMNSLIIPFVRMTGCGVAWALGAPLVAYVAVWFASSAISYLMLPLLGYLEMKRRDRWRAAMGGGLSLKPPEPKTWRFVIYTNIDSSLAAGAAQLPVILAGAVGGASFAAIFRIAQEVAIVLRKGAAMMDRVIYPEFTNLIAQGEGARVPGLVLRTGAAMMAIGSAVGLVFWLVGPVLLSQALGPAYAEATGLAVILIVAASTAAASGPLFPAFYAAGKPKKAIFARLAGLIVMVGGFSVGYALFGPLGAGAAVLAGALVSLLLAVYIARRHDWSVAGHAALSASRTAAGDASTDDDRTGGPGQPGSSSGRSSE